MSDETQHEDQPAQLRVALLTNCLSPHTLPLCQAISTRVREFRAFLSQDLDTFHKFPKMQGSFPVTLQRSFNGLRYLRREHGFWTRNQLHFPYDTFQQLRRYGPDAIISSQFGIRTVLSTLYRLQYPRVRLFLWANLSTHTEQKRAWYRRALRRWVVRHIDGAFVNGTGGEDYLRSLGYTGPVAGLPYTIDEAQFRRRAEYRPVPGLVRLLYCGRIDPCKGVRVFCERLNNWCVANPQARVHFELVGDGPDAGAIRSLQTSPNLRISVLPRMDQSRLAGRYETADLFVLPTLYDEWAVVVNEAMNAGLPVLGSIYGQAVTELVIEDDCGWTFDPQSEQNTYGALDRVFRCDAERLGKMSLNARRRIAQFSPARVASRAVRVIETVVYQGAAESREGMPKRLRSRQSLSGERAR